MRGSDWAAIIVALISIATGIFAGRSAQRVARINTQATESNQKVIAETESYQRARRMDIETNERQTQRIKDLEEENEVIRRAIRQLREENQILHEDNDRLRRRIGGLEQRQEEHSDG